MQRTLLYYPSIVINNPQWIRQSILYWDAIGSIVPSGMERFLKDSDDTQILMDQGLYKIYRPDAYVQTNERLARELETALDDKRFTKSLPKEDRYNGWIYSYKFAPDLIENLVKRSIAKRISDKVYLSHSIASLYMSLLAKHMANDDVNAITTPSTDDTDSLRFAFPSIGGEKSMNVMNLSLHNVLPVPAEGTRLINIIKFKQRRKDELLQFRQTIYEHQDKIKQLQDPGEVRDLNSRFAEQIQIEVSNLGKALKSDNIHFFFGSLKSLLYIQAAPMIVAYALQFPDPIKLKMSVAGAVISAAISFGEYFLTAQNKENERLAKDAYTYVLLAKEEGII